MGNCDEKVILALKIARAWKSFKIFCEERTTCKGCPYFDGKVCSKSDDRSVLYKIAGVAEDFLTENDIV